MTIRQRVKSLLPRLLLLIVLVVVWLLLPDQYYRSDHWLARLMPGGPVLMFAGAKMWLAGPLIAFALVFFLMEIFYPAARYKRTPGWHTRNTLFLVPALVVGLFFLYSSIGAVHITVLPPWDRGVWLYVFAYHKGILYGVWAFVGLMLHLAVSS